MGLRAWEGQKEGVALAQEWPRPYVAPLGVSKCRNCASILDPAFEVPEAKEPSQSLAGEELICPKLFLLQQRRTVAWSTGSVGRCCISVWTAHPL